MKAENWERVDLWVADLFGLPASMVWQPGVTVGMHAVLGDYPGIVVFGREGAIHVSLPDWAGRKLIDELVEVSPTDLLEPKFWATYRRTSGHKVLGPQVHSFSDTQLEPPSKVERIPASDIAHWRDVVSRRKWEASGFAEQVEVAFAMRSGDEIAAAANLTSFRGVPSDVGVLTHPKYRGKGFSSRVARAAAAYAVRNHEIARYRSDVDNLRSRSVSKALDFEDYFTQLTIQPRD
ncbi:MAG TPA: GNAT family N-acetyltransferase [Nocardioidaceae bacterium]|nr:GNAT family N-acetyltransferase [Nocardioidaceae bacterium]